MRNSEDLKSKGFDPQFLIKEFEKYFVVVGEKYSVTFGESLQQRKNTLNYFKKYDDFNEAMDFTRIVKKTLKDSKKAVKAVSKGKQIPEPSVTEEDFKKLEEKSNFVTHFDLDMFGFEKINKEYLQLQFRHHISGITLNGLIASGLLQIFTGIVTFSLTLAVSIWIEEPMSKFLSILGEILSKAVPALIVYLIFDRLIESIKNKLLWQRVNVCRTKAENIKNEIAAAALR